MMWMLDYMSEELPLFLREGVRMSGSAPTLWNADTDLRWSQTRHVLSCVSGLCLVGVISSKAWSNSLRASGAYPLLVAINWMAAIGLGYGWVTSWHISVSGSKPSRPAWSLLVGEQLNMTVRLWGTSWDSHITACDDLFSFACMHLSKACCSKT